MLTKTYKDDNAKFRLDSMVEKYNRDIKIPFKFNGKTYFGYEGDTLASALLANGIHLIGRSFKYHRPRGFFAAGVDDALWYCSTLSKQ